MKLLTFKYTKADSSESNRVFVPMTSPNTMFEGYDISELDQEQQALYLIELSNIYDTYIVNMAQLNKRFDMNYRYRRFDPAKMSEVISEEI